MKIKKEIRLQGYFNDLFNNKTFSEIRLELKKLEEKYKGDFLDFRIQWDYSEDYGDTFEIYGIREETDEEYNRRIKIEKEEEDRKLKEKEKRDLIKNSPEYKNRKLLKARNMILGIAKENNISLKDIIQTI